MLAPLLEAVEHRKIAGLRPHELAFEKLAADLFERQHLAFVKLTKLRLVEAEPAVRYPDFSDTDWDSAMASVQGNFATEAHRIAGESMILGAGDAAGDFNLPSTFALPNPEATAYLSGYGATLVTNINDQTRTGMRTLLTTARAEGWSYDRLARQISSRWTGFYTPMPQQHIRNRAHLIAVTETAAAYERGNLFTYGKLRDAGLPLEYSWQVAGDSRVCPICDGHSSRGWVGAAQWGEAMPPGHPACRCTLAARLASNGKARMDSFRKNGFPPDALEIGDISDQVRNTLKALGYDDAAIGLFNKADTIRALARSGWERGRIVREFKVTHSQVYQALGKKGVVPPIRTPPPYRPPPVYKPPPTPPPVAGSTLSELEQRLLMLRKEGLGAQSVANIMEMSVNQVRYYWRKIDAKLAAEGGTPGAIAVKKAVRAGKPKAKWYQYEMQQEIEKLVALGLTDAEMLARLMAKMGNAESQLLRNIEIVKKRLGVVRKPGNFLTGTDLENWLKSELPGAERIYFKGMHVDAANDLGKVFEDLISKGYKPALENLTTIQMKRLGKNTYAHVWDKGSRSRYTYPGGGLAPVRVAVPDHVLEFNNYWFSDARYAAYSRQSMMDAAMGFHPKALAKYEGSIATTAYHEFGHALENFIKGRLNRPGGWLTNSENEKWFASFVDNFAANSRYGLKNRQEKWAELFEEYFTGTSTTPGLGSFIDDIERHMKAGDFEVTAL